MFVCVDCETTGLDPKEDEIVEIAVVVFSDKGEHVESFETLVKPRKAISAESQKIHGISAEMLEDQPHIEEVLPRCVKMLKDHIIVGHGIQFDIDMVSMAAKKHQIPCKIESQKSLDTLRLARLYGESPTNSLEALRKHFNIPQEGAHRAMNDVVVNIQVFLHLTKDFKTTHDIFERLKRPIQMRSMPLGKHKGRLFKDIPIEYLRWAAHQKFDQDLLYSIRKELKNRKNSVSFAQASNPFSNL